MARSVSVKVNEREWQRYRERLARGALNFAYAVLGDAQEEAPVRGGYRSFAPDGPVGGTLRRSLHAAVWLDGVPIPGSILTDENGVAIPGDYPVPGKGITVIVGTNSGYGWYVEGGTVRMAQRPFLAPAWDANLPEAGNLVRAGMGAA